MTQSGHALVHCKRPLSGVKRTYSRHVIVDYFSRIPSPHTVVVLERNGDGAIKRVPESATAFGHRAWPYNFLVTSAWSDPTVTERNIAWTREFFDAMKPFLVNEGMEGLKGSYGEAKYSRLAAIKSKYDPINLFRMNQNIPPVSTAA